MAVVLFHFGSSAASKAGAPHLAVHLLQNGYLGVTFFFILSGFILTFSYFNRELGREGMRGFFVARIARIYPVYALGLLLVLPFQSPSSPLALLATTTLTQSWTPSTSDLPQEWNSPGWTLSIEAFFYLLFPIFLPLIKRLSRPMAIGLIGAILVLIGALDLSNAQPGWQPAGVWLTMTPLPILRLPEFLLGMLLGSLRMEDSEANHGAIALPIALIVTLVVFAISPYASRLAALLFAIIIFSAASGSSHLHRMLGSSVLVYLGGASYAIYLLQDSMNGYFDLAFPGSLIARLAMPLGLVACACLVFTYFEEPARKLINSFRRK
jgi:peptidoglycan/LPS O-acetylase OafA/YrhL